MFVEIDQAPIYIKNFFDKENADLKNDHKEDALLIHGVPDSAEIWNSLVPMIQHKYNCYAPDLPGFHRSGMPYHYKFGFDHYADFIDSLVRKLQLKTPLTLIIHDWGGIFGMLWACKYPHKVKRIIGGDFPFSESYKWHEWATIWRLPIAGELSMLLMNWPLFKWELQRSSRRLSVQDMKETYEGRVTQWRTRMTVLKMYRSANTSNFKNWALRQKQLSELAPIDLIWGKDDPHVPSDQANLMNPRSIEIVENCGHWVPQEAPEVYADVILNNGTKK